MNVYYKRMAPVVFGKTEGGLVGWFWGLFAC